MTVRYPYPDREGNSFRLLVGSGAFLPAMLSAIAAARDYILLEQYLVGSGVVAGRMIEALLAARRRGVAVGLLLDHFGSHDLALRDRQRLSQSGVHLLFYNPAYLHHFLRSLHRNHRKVLLIDGVVGFTGGAGITDDYDPAVKPAWHDVVLQMRGPVLGDWQAQFLSTWERWRGGGLQLAAPVMAPAGEQKGRLVPSFRWRHKFLRHALLRQIRQSEQRVWIATAYFLPPLFMLRALRQARERGVDVRLLLPGPINDHPTVYQAGRRYYHYLLRHGIRVYEYLPAFMHAKVYLCDDWCSVGSCNMDRWGLRWNLEANQESCDSGLAGELAAFFADDFGQAHEFTLDQWLARSRWQRFGEWLFGYGDLLIERFGVFWGSRKRGMNGNNRGLLEE